MISLIRIIRPALDLSGDAAADAVITAIRQTQAETLPSLTSSAVNNGRRNLVRIPQAPCGELTGSITGNVWCYGYAIHEGVRLQNKSDRRGRKIRETSPVFLP